MPQQNPNALTVKLALLLTSTLTVMAGATIAPALPAIQEHFASVPRVEYLVRLLLSIPALCIVFGSTLSGMIIDRFGRKMLLVFSVALYGAAGASGFVLQGINEILVGRALLGLAVGGIMTSATTLIADYYTGSTRAYYMGLQAAFMGFGGVLFLSLGGFLAEVSWRSPFLIYFFAWCILPLIITALYEPIQPQAASTPQERFLTPVPIRLLLIIYTITFLSQVCFYLIPVQLPFYLKTLVDASATQTGYAIATTTFFSALMSIAYGRIQARLDFARILVLSFALMGVGYLAISAAAGYLTVILGLVLAGTGLGLLMPNMTVWVSSIAPDYLRGRALGTLTTAFFLGQFVSPLLSQPLSSAIGLSQTFTIAGSLLLTFSLLIVPFQPRFKQP